MLLALISFFVGGAISVPSIVFRLDDLQCSWEMNNSFTIMDIFWKYNIPLSVGVITGFGDCYKPGLLQRFIRANGNLEVASHTVHHEPMTGFNKSSQLFEVQNSKAELEALLGNGTVRTFIPQTNVWNYVTISVLQEAGYDIVSGQCTIAQIEWPSIDYMCSANMYPVRPAFFPAIDGVIHMPTGASIASYLNLSQLLTTDQLVSGPNTLCWNDNMCSIQTQLNAVANLTDPNDASWSVIMMHPQDFSDDAASIESFFAAIFAAIQPNYRFVTFSQLAGPRGSRPFVNSTTATTTISTNSNPNSNSNSSLASTTTIAKINFAMLLVLALVLAH